MELRWEAATGSSRRSRTETSLINVGINIKISLDILAHYTQMTANIRCEDDAQQEVTGGLHLTGEMPYTCASPQTA